jgi:UDP-2,3-diacylglucosamine hydrolase
MHGAPPGWMGREQPVMGGWGERQAALPPQAGNTGSLGLVAGSGTLPALMAGEARRAGWRVVAFTLGDAAALDETADRVVRCRLGDVGPIFEVLTGERIRHVVLAGRISKDGLFHGAPLDDTARALLDRAPDWTDDGLLRTGSAALAAMGIEVLDQRRFLEPWLAPAGPAAGPAPGEAVRADIVRGLAVARVLAGQGIGQTVVLRAGSVAAVEAMEGTDETIRRGLALAGAGAVVVKATAASHDYRFDVPAVGAATLALCVQGRAAALAVEAGRVLLLDRETVADAAERAGISLVGVTGGHGTD